MESYEELFNSQVVVSETLTNKLEELITYMNCEKQKNAELEEQWLKLKADFVERERLLMSSSERGFSDLKWERRIENSNTKFVQSPTVDSNVDSQENKSLINVVDEETKNPQPHQEQETNTVLS